MKTTKNPTFNTPLVINEVNLTKTELLTEFPLKKEVKQPFNFKIYKEDWRIANAIICQYECLVCSVEYNTPELLIRREFASDLKIELEEIKDFVEFQTKWN